MWISIKERLPSLDLHVLLCDEHGWMFTGCHNGKAFEHANGEEPGMKVTHWRLLPNRPSK